MRLKGELLATTATKAPRSALRCYVSNKEIEDMGPQTTWPDWRALFLSKEIPPSRLHEGADFRMSDKPGGIEIEFP